MDTKTVENTFKIQVAASQPMVTAQSEWTKIYENKADWLNTYVRSLNLGAAIAGEIARSVTIEMKVDITGSARGLYLQTVISQIIAELRQQVEIGCAKAGFIIKPYVAGGELLWDYFPADSFFPIAFDGKKNLTDVIFPDVRRDGEWYYTRLEYHQKIDKGWRITNKAFRSTTQGDLGSEVPLGTFTPWAEIKPMVEVTPLKQPLFGYFRYPMANNIDSSSPLPVSCFARAVDLIEQADILWSDLLWEFESGRRAIDVDELAFERDKKTGKPILPNKRLYRTYATGGSNIGGKGDLFKDWSPTLREQNIINGLESILRRIEFNCGISYGILSEPKAVQLTATEIKASKQTYFANVVDIQKALQKCLDGAIYAIDILATYYKLAKKGNYSTSYGWDDSIIADHATEFTENTQAVGIQVMSRLEFRMVTYGETKEKAAQMLALVTKEQSAGDLFNDGESDQEGEADPEDEPES